MSAYGSRGASLRTIALASASVLSLCLMGSAARAQTVFNFDIPQQPLSEALRAYARVAGDQIIFNDDLTRGRTATLHGTYTPDEALAKILKGSKLAAERLTANEVMVGPMPEPQPVKLTRVAAGVVPVRAAAAAGIESVVVTSSKIKGDIQTVPIAITALSQEQLTQRQIAGGPDLVKEVPNLTFSKTNFSGYNIEIRGIGTQAISVTTDPAVAVAFNDTPFIRNHFFEQEFFDVSQVEVLRGPQGTLYGRNATAGVVNVVSAKPTDQFEAMLSADWGNYKNRRYEGMVNLPIAGDRLALRVAGEWTKRDGYSFNEITNTPIDGRDLWSARVTLGWKPASNVEADFIWEHFQENDDRLRSGKQLCKTDPGPATMTAANGSVIQIPQPNVTVFSMNAANYSQGCLPASLYDTGHPDAAIPDYGNFGVPNGFALPFVSGLGFFGDLNGGVDPYSQVRQSTNLRDIQSTIDPIYKAKNDTLELNASWNVTPALTLYSDTGFNRDYLWSSEDYNRFNTSPGIFHYGGGALHSNEMLDPGFPNALIYCDPQLGCSDRIVVEDLSTEDAWQISQEFRLASNFTGPFNFSAGGNYLHYETTEKYYVFSNSFTLIAAPKCAELVFGQENLSCLPNGKGYSPPAIGSSVLGERYVDTNPLTALDDAGHNYFLSRNPYVLNSYAAFGEAYYDVTPELKFTAGLRWTDDEKHFTNFPSQLLADGYGYPTTGSVDQKWNKWTGRAVANWSPKLDFTDQSMFYASYAHGYKAGGANPPGAVLLAYSSSAPGHSNSSTPQYAIPFPVHPLTFEPEFIDAYELGTKNTMLDGGLTLNGDVFFYNYKGYQISQIVDRTSVNLNFDATVRGAEIEATYEPLQGLKFSFAGGYEDTNINKNQSAIDLMDRTAGHPGWVLMRPWVGQSSNCIFPEYVAVALLQRYLNDGEGNIGPQACGIAYHAGFDPVTAQPYSATTYPITIAGQTIDGIPVPPMSYPGYDPLSVDSTVNSGTVNQGLGLPPNNGEGFAKNVGGNQLPGAPHFTASLTGEYTMPVSANWAATLHSDFYWQSQSFARVFNDRPYDKIRGYSTTNVALILTDGSGWQVMGYVKNIFDVTAVTGDFLNSDDSGLTTNIFLTDPRLYGVRITKNFEEGDGGFDLFSNSNGKRPQIWLQVGGNYEMLSAGHEKYVPPFEHLIPSPLPQPSSFEKAPKAGFDWEGRLSYLPEDSDWVLVAGIRYGRSSKNKSSHVSLPTQTRAALGNGRFSIPCAHPSPVCSLAPYREFEDTRVSESEHHTILDFTLGKDVGLGTFGGRGTSTIGGGLRIAQFSSRAGGLFNTDPQYNFPVNFKYQNHEIYNGSAHEERSFHGIGPELTWEASHPLLGDVDSGQVTLDWGLNAAILFGRQKARVEHQAYHIHCRGGLNVTCYQAYSPATVVESFSRSKNVTVPNLGGYAGLSVRYNDAKISFGYRADEFFNAMDGGQATAKKYDRGFYGPYLNISIGLGD